MESRATISTNMKNREIKIKLKNGEDIHRYL
jgi:hypothetical protein